jgi:hypothetical protein
MPRKIYENVIPGKRNLEKEKTIRVEFLIAPYLDSNAKLLQIIEKVKG